MRPIHLFYAILGAGSALAAVYSLFDQSATDLQRKYILVFWFIAPPVFFFFEYYFRGPKLKDRELERVKDMQQRAAAIWAGVAAALGVVYFEGKSSDRAAGPERISTVSSLATENKGSSSFPPNSDAN